MAYKIYILGHPLQKTPMGDRHNAVFKELGVPITFERFDVPPVNFHREISELMRSGEFLGAKIARPYKQTALAYCQEVSSMAKSTGVVNTLIKRPSGLIYGHNTAVQGFTKTLREAKATNIRSALILGAGEAARLALAGLREMGCARYLVGYRHPRRPTELSSQFKGIRRQIDYFPLEEMVEFFKWSQQADVFSPDMLLPPPPKRPKKSGNGKDDLKRWSLLVNATPVGAGPMKDQSLISNINFLRCFEQVLDMVPAQEPTPLLELAKNAAVPCLPGYRIYELQATYSRDLWLKEYRRHEGLEEPAKPVRKRPVFRRRRR